MYHSTLAKQQSKYAKDFEKKEGKVQKFHTDESRAFRNMRHVFAQGFTSRHRL
jgi:ribosomal protein S17E